MADIQATANRIVENVERVMVGKRQPVQLTVIEPTFDPFDGSLDFDPVKIAQSMAHGYELTGQILGQGTP